MKYKSEMSLKVSSSGVLGEATGWLDIDVIGRAAAPDDVLVKVSLRGREVVGKATVGVEEVKVNVSFRIGREGVKEPEEEEMLLSVASYSHKKLVSCSPVSLARV